MSTLTSHLKDAFNKHLKHLLGNYYVWGTFLSAKNISGQNLPGLEWILNGKCKKREGSNQGQIQVSVKKVTLFWTCISQLP